MPWPPIAYRASLWPFFGTTNEIGWNIFSYEKLGCRGNPEYPITANVGTEGANENFPIWTFFEFRDRFAYISLSFAPITLKLIWIPRDNSYAINCLGGMAKLYFLM
jgi:hypothetical protein